MNICISYICCSICNITHTHIYIYIYTNMHTCYMYYIYVKYAICTCYSKCNKIGNYAYFPAVMCNF